MASMKEPRPRAATEAAARHRAEHGWKLLEGFAGLLSMPNVTGDTDRLELNAGALADCFERRGASMQVVQVEDAAPVVIGELRAKDATATLGVYVHYDGQPVDADNWSSPPFQPTLATAPWHQGGEVIPLPGPDDDIDPEWRLYARGASDDKTPFAAITAAVDALEGAGLSPRVDLLFL